jgi:hypothetical protein
MRWLDFVLSAVVIVFAAAFVGVLVLGRQMVKAFNSDTEGNN